jgi:Domain of unknown function (DUF4062)
MEKRFQVFVSSTYADLHEERKEVIQALLELKCMPAGMELFPAATDDQWTLIKKVIDDCDYYIVVVAGRYGSTDKDGVSFTEKEYRYALDQNKPILGFLHKNTGSIPSSMCESEPSPKAKLEDFIRLVKEKHVRFWSSPTELGSVVSRSLVQAMSSHPAIGWVKASNIPSESAAQEILKLRNEILRLEGSIQAAQHSAPSGTENLSQGEDDANIQFFPYAKSVGAGFNQTELAGPVMRCSISWSKLFARVGPLLIGEASTSQVYDRIKQTVDIFGDEKIKEWLRTISDEDTEYVQERIVVVTSVLETILVQFRALGLIEKSQKPRSIKTQGTFWTLTLYGDALLTRLLAQRKS